jgi:hypothetical protein
MLKAKYDSILRENSFRPGPLVCPSCSKKPSEIVMFGYCGDAGIVLCRSCALQLARKLLEDLCELDGDRHG